jgi:putative spermidine/putrescine transport system permease protein
MWKLAIYLFLIGFIINLLGIVSHVVVSSFAKRWFSRPLPPAFTTDWYSYAWTNFELGHVLFITLLIAPPTSWRGATST